MMKTTSRMIVPPLPPPLPPPSQAATTGHNASYATTASAQAVATVAATRHSGLGQDAVAAARRMPSLTPAFCVNFTLKLNVCYSWHRMQYFQGSFPPNSGWIPDSDRFRNILILPWND